MSEIVSVQYYDITEKEFNDIKDKPDASLITEWGIYAGVNDDNLYLIRDLHDDGCGKMCIIPRGCIVSVRNVKSERKVKLK